MAIRKKASKINLATTYKYISRDTTPFSDNLFNIVNFPDRFTAGKNLFKLRIDTATLVNNSQIYIEILDFNGDAVYWEPLNYVEKDGTRVISVYIYPDTAPGIATVFIAGRIRDGIDDTVSYERDYNSPNHPDIPNAIWSRKIPIAPYALNKSEIIYTVQPSLTIKETVHAYLQPTDILNTFTQVTASNNSSLTITPAPNTLNTANVNTAPNTEGSLSPKSPNSGKQFFNNSAMQSMLQNTAGASTSSPVLTTLTGFSKLTTTNFALNHNMQGGIITVNNPTVTAPPLVGMNSSGKVIAKSQTATEYSSNTGNQPSSRQLSGSLEFAIEQVYNSTTARVALIGGFKNNADNTNGPFSILVGTGVPVSTTVGNKIQYSQPASSIINTVNTATSFTASFTKQSDVITTENSSSFADIIIANAEPDTGDVYRIKTLYKPSGFFGDFIDLGDTILEQQNILIDTGSLETYVAVGSLYEHFGMFEDLSEINTYWSASQVGTGLNANALTLTYDDDILMGGAKLTTNWGSSQYIAKPDNATIFHIRPQYRPMVYAGSTYTVKFQCALPADINLYSTQLGYIDSMRLDVYVSGSVVSIDDTKSNIELTGNTSTDIKMQSTLVSPFNDAGTIGTRIGTVRSKNTPNQTGIIKFEFKALSTGPIDVKFVTRAGSWIIGAIDVIADKQTGFSPNHIRIFKRIPTEHLKTPLTFKFQYYDYRGAKADLETIAYGTIFNGGNTYIDGTDNLMTGSVYIGNTVGSGIKMAGVSSGYIQSVGYNGFTQATDNTGPGGFLLWSGSNNLIVGNDTYLGVGLEMVSSPTNYFRYRTNPAELDVRTDKFFFGSNNQFISGANSNIEISSSNFHLNASGDVVMSGTVTADAGNIGGFAISATDITGDNIVIDSAGTIRTANYISNVQGWSISADGNGFAEFENAKIRGTLSTAVFEKESVNAVGGQLYVANSTVLTGSGDLMAFANSLYHGQAPQSIATGNYTEDDTVLAVVNCTGFVTGEILVVKKVTSTGFSTEYLEIFDDGDIDGSVRAFPDLETDLSGLIAVKRGQGKNLSSGSFGDAPGVPTPYSGSQVIVSTGAVGTGFIRLNANPNDAATPYIDIVERYGTAVNQVTLKARLGDLSGLAGTAMVHQESDPGFGLATDNVYLQGAIIATSGEIGGFTIANSYLADSATNGSTFQVNGAATDDQDLISSEKFTLKANGNITASNALFSGNVTAVNFSKQQVTVTNANSGSYFQPNGAGINLVFNGSLGGDKIMVMTIACATNPSLLIKNIILPNTGSAVTAEVDVFINQHNVEFDDTDIQIATAFKLT